MRSTARSNEGFTLVELLVAMTVSGLIMTAIGGACFVGINTTSNSQRGLDQSNVEQLIGHWLVGDVQSACNPAITAPSCPRSPNPSTTSTSECGSTVLFAMDTLSSLTATAAHTTIVYVLQNGMLTRLVCAYGGSSATASDTLAQHVSSATASYPVSGSCAGQFQLSVTIAGSGTGASAWSLDLDANPASVGSPLIGSSAASTVGSQFQASIGTKPWTDAYVSYDPTTYQPTITHWVRRA